MIDISTSESATQVGRRFLEALTGQAWDGLAGCFEANVQMRALTPKGLRAADDREAATAWFRKWFGEADQLEVLSWTVEEFCGRLRVAYRLRTHEDRWYRIEQQGFWTVADGAIRTCDLVCSGFRPEADD